MDKRTSRSSDKDFLDYYHSPLAGQGHCYQLARHSRQLSTSSSEYSCQSDSKDATSSDASSQVSQVTRRSSTRSVGSADRRRIAIVEMEAPAEESSHDSTTLRSRRGLNSSLSGLAIVVPPDISQKSFVLLSPPSTAPLSSTAPDPHPASIPPHHQRSASEILPYKKTRSRDIGIVGTAQLTSGAKQEQGTATPGNISHMQTTNNNNNAVLQPPLFQQPKSASPSPSPEPTRSLAPVRGLNLMKRENSKELPSTPTLVPTPAAVASATPSPQLTPEIGESKDMHVPVAPPIVVGPEAVANALPVGGIRLVTQPKPEPSAPVSAATPTPATVNTTSPPTLVLPATDPTISYVNYQPGVHSTAGPLPPPPRLPGFDGLSTSPLHPPPPRPPRLNSPLPPRSAARTKDLEAVKQALQLPPSVSAALVSKSSESLKNESKQTAAKPKSTSGESNAPPSAVLVARSTSSSTMPSSPSFSESSSSSYSVVQPSSVHRREGAFPPSSSDSVNSERERRRGVTTGKLEADDATPISEIPDAEGTVPKVTIISEPPPPPSPILEEPSVEHEEDTESLRPQHRREHANDQISVMSDNDDLNENWVAISRVSSPSSHHDRSTSLDLHHNGSDRESSRTPSEVAPSPPPKSFRNSLTTGLKRFSSRSLPRTPSISSGGSRRSSVMSKRFSTGSTSLGNGTMTPNGSASASGIGSGVDITTAPLPSVHPMPLPIPTRAATVHGHGIDSGSGSNGVTGVSTPVHGHGRAHPQMKSARRRKMVVQWPSAMFCNEIHAVGKKKLSSSERCSIYARKINELYMYDCGLTEWVMETKYRGPNSNVGGNGANKKFLEMRSPASAPFTPQPRQTSRSSMISDATFPTRPDATTATDLLSSSHDEDGGFREDVPPLPYPSLATAQRAAASNVVASPNLATMTPPTSIRSLGSSSTLPSMAGSNNTPIHNTHTHTHSHSHSTHLHTPATTFTSLTHLQSPTTSLSPTNKHLSNTSAASPSLGGGFFASLGRKASLTSAKRPNLGLGLGSLISSPISSSSSSSSNGLTSPQSSSNRLLSKPPPGSVNGSPASGSNKLQKSNIGLSGLQMNPATPPSSSPVGPRAPTNSNRVQRSKTYMPTASSPFSGGGGYGGGHGPRTGGGIDGGSGRGTSAGIERRPSLWELQLNSTSSPSGMTSSGLPASPLSGSNTPTTTFSPHSYGNPHVHSSGYATDSYVPPLHHHSQPHTAPVVQYSQPQQVVCDPHADPEFIRQVDRLAELVPHADKMVLTGYLRRAGQDVLAIGQYLEDEKNGTLKAY